MESHTPFEISRTVDRVIQHKAFEGSDRLANYVLEELREYYHKQIIGYELFHSLERRLLTSPHLAPPTP
jgi:hypothetical protein